MENIYWERQSGGLCRKHSLNVYFGKNKISELDFNNYCNEYDEYLRNTGRAYDNVINNDIIPSNQNTIISYIIEKIENKHCIYIQLGGLKKYMVDYKYSGIIDLIKNSNCIFLFNEGHIYCLKYINKEWYKIDSLSGISNYDINHINNEGLIIPRTNCCSILDLIKYSNNIFDYLYKNNIKKITDKLELYQFLIELYNKQLLLDELEVNLGIISSILNILKLSDSSNEITKDYNEFIILFEKTKNIIDIVNYIPDLIIKLYNLNQNLLSLIII
jgi:hypothetical protein